MVAEHGGFAQAGLEHHHVLHVQPGFKVVAGGHAFEQGVTAGDTAQLGKLRGEVLFQVRGIQVQAAGFDPGQQQRE
ncbi:hypothetical protein D3C73_1147330 [compost metagenome]